MKSLVFLGLILCSLSINVDQTLFVELSEKMSSIGESDTGKFIIELASLHAEMRGPLDDLIATIYQLQTDLQDELKLLDANFQRRSNDNQRDVQLLEQTIGEAEIDVANAQDGLDGYLLPSKEAINARIAQLKININDNRQALQREGVQSDRDRSSYEERVAEHQSALDALDKALSLVGQLLNNPSSFAQGPAITNSIKEIQKSLKKKADFAPMIAALLSVAQNFSDQNGVKQIIQMLTDLRNNIVDSLNQETADEAQRQQNWQARQQALNSEHLEFQRAVNEQTIQLSAIDERISSEQDFKSARQSDLASFKEQLELEQTTFASEQQLYSELRQQLLEEIAVASKAYDFINSAEFSNYITSRINRAAVIV